MVQQFCSGWTVDSYVEDVLVRSAVERQLAIIGEALNRLSKTDPETAADLATVVYDRGEWLHDLQDGTLGSSGSPIAGPVDRQLGSSE